MHNIYSVMMMTYKDKVRNFGFIAVVFATVIGAFLCIPEKSPLLIMTIEPGVIMQGGNPTWMPMVSDECLEQRKRGRNMQMGNGMLNDLKR
ncbi:MAG: hypothetical protein ATN35_07295 [Epulopiscium sp. Nele67-Bin004]|nr:MAG: hypothetical protein ATN35_07295 [Epulopiscium sp. Nele67-Bin004]